MPATKDDPLESGRTAWAGRTVWLDRENMQLARDNFWRAYNELYPTAVGNLDDHHTWDVAWAAAIAAYAYLMEGRLEPGP